MHSVVIADTSFLIAIHKLQLFDQVKDLYKEVHITKKIVAEFQLALPAWIIIREPHNFHFIIYNRPGRSIRPMSFS